MTLTIPILEYSLAEDVGGVSQAFNTYFTNVPSSRFLEDMAMDSKYLFLCIEFCDQLILFILTANIIFVISELCRELY